MRSSHTLLHFHANLCEGRRRAAWAGVWAAMVLALAATATARGQIDPSPILIRIPETVNPVSTQIQQDLKMAGNYLVGKNVPKDPVQAAYWFKKAADQGDPGAQNELGYLYVWGIGVERDPAQAMRWFSRAAGAGWQQAKLNMAVMYMKGIGVARDQKFALELMQELAAKKNARAEDYLGVMYLNGQGVDRDSQAAEEWFSRAAKDKNPEGEYAIGQLYSVDASHEHDFGKAAKFLRESAKAGYVPAMYMLGVLLTNHPEAGKGDEGVSWLVRAAEAGTWQSSATLGAMARDGRGVRQDMGEAFRWFTIAAKQAGPAGEVKMSATLAQCRAALPARVQEEQEAAAENWLAQHPNADLFVFDDVRSQFPVGEVYAMRASATE